MSSLRPIKVWGAGGPNPPKVGYVCEELNIPYEVVDIPFPELKQPDYLTVNPNGRMPAIHDPNTGLTLWESGAIVEYLVERYDTERKISFEPWTNQAQLARQWLFFQVSGQGPYYGQFMWFHLYHPEKLQSVLDRYEKEIHRVTGVLEGHLKQQKESGVGGADGPWMVGGKFSYADVVFVPWQCIAPGVLGKLDKWNEDDYPLVKEWLAKMTARPGIKKVIEEVQPFFGRKGGKH